jgi:hypothetical protein
MKKHLISVAAAAILLASASAAPANKTSQGEPAKAAEAAGGGAGEAKKICRRLVNSGTRLGSGKTCHTKEEWKKIEQMN